MSESLSVYYVNGSFFVSPIEAIFFACLLCCGPLTGCICILLTYTFCVTRDGKKYWHFFNISKRYLLFNGAHQLIILLVIHRLHHVLLALCSPLTILPALILSPLYFTLSCIINALFYKVEDGESFRTSFKDIFSPYYRTAFPASFAAVIIARAYPRFGLLSPFIMLTPLIVTLVSMKHQAAGNAE